MPGQTFAKFTDLYWLIRSIVSAQEIFSIRISKGNCGGFLNIRNVQYYRFDFTEFNLKTVNFHLMINPADKFNISIRHKAGQITGSIHSVRRDKRIGANFSSVSSGRFK